MCGYGTGYKSGNCSIVKDISCWGWKGGIWWECFTGSKGITWNKKDNAIWLKDDYWYNIVISCRHTTSFQSWYDVVCLQGSTQKYKRFDWLMRICGHIARTQFALYWAVFLQLYLDFYGANISNMLEVVFGFLRH